MKRKKIWSLRKEANLPQLRVILSGGGTGGHIFPAVSIANQIKKQVPDAEILFVGALGKMEMEKVPAAGYKIIGLPISGLQRKLTLSNLSFPFKVISSLLKAKKILKDFKPHVVIGTGGYASGPMLRAAASKGIPTLIQEQNAYPGITNKLLAKKVSTICVGCEGMEKFFPKEKIVYTGNPVRQDISGIEEKRKAGLEFFALDPNKKILLVVGGSLGAKGVNEAMGINLRLLTENNIQLLWQTGKVYIDTAKQQVAPFADKNIKALDFITKMDLAYAVADCVVSRAGAGAVAELCIIKKPSILVPLLTAAEDHQTKNAMALVNKNAAILVRDDEAKGKLVEEAVALMKNESRQNELKQNIAKLAMPNAAEKITEEVLKLVKR
jgi:UDP-N-acetylglucosamine--N-acetylmuramyl-(pentapeptide) pyrophosphoryl-undecaprenol N-acetylglucosamine transferase